jgi:hypothetical protein
MIKRIFPVLFYVGALPASQHQVLHQLWYSLYYFSVYSIHSKEREFIFIHSENILWG